MKNINLNFQPVNRQGEPHVIDYPAGKFLMEILDKRINQDRPALESSLANQLAATVDDEPTYQFSINDIRELENLPSDLEYLVSIIQNLPYDNLLKGQILDRFAG